MNQPSSVQSLFRTGMRRWRRGVAPLMLATALGVAGCAGGGTGLGLQLVSPEQVAEAGEQSWQQIKSQQPASTNSAYRQRVNRVADRVLRGAGENPADWEVVVFQGAEANAFALPGNKIGVYEGMLEMAKTDDQLAAVIGHEIAHVERAHAVERVNSQAATQLGVQVVGGVLQSTGTGGGALASVLGAGAQYGLLLPYARNQELEADRLGLITMARAGYNPRAAIELWQNMQAAGSGGQPEFLSTHPDPGNRIAQLERMMPEAEAARRSAGS